jgi:hypothetical protein
MNEPCSLNRIAELTGISRGKITEAVHAALIPPADYLAGHPRYDLSAALRAVIKSLVCSIDPGQLSPRARRDHIEAERAALKLALERREVLPIDAIQEGCARAYAVVRQHIDAIPDHLERRGKIPPEGAQLAHSIIQSALGELANNMQALYIDSTEKAEAAEDFAERGARSAAADIEAEVAALF